MRCSHSWRWAAVGACALGIGVMAWSVNAAEETAREGAAPSPEQMMAQYMALAAPGPEHAELAKMAGEWEAEIVSYCDPSGTPQHYTGTQSSEMILGGRFLRCEFAGEMMGMPFEGVSLVGYDNVKQQYNNLWADTMSTAWMTSTGEADADGSIKFVGSYDDPIQGKTVIMRQVVTVVDDDHHRFEMFGPNPDPASSGEEIKMMQIDYTRTR